LSLNTALGRAVDAVFTDLPELQAFAMGKASGPDLRSYLRETPWAQCQVVFYGSKSWTAEGGTLYGECYYLVNEVQMLLAGQPQSLANLKHEIPSHHYQWSINDGPGQGTRCEREWEIHNLDDVARFEARLRTWLPEVILPWTAQFRSMEAIVLRLRQQQKRFALAELLARLGRRSEAGAALLELLTHDKARFSRPQLLRLRDAGLLRAEDVDALALAGDMRGDPRLSIVKRWMAGRDPAGN
jgi:hypothetical protein